jgi:hypothetical protein
MTVLQREERVAPVSIVSGAGSVGRRVIEDIGVWAFDITWPWRNIARRPFHIWAALALGYVRIAVLLGCLG